LQRRVASAERRWYHTLVDSLGVAARANQRPVRLTGTKIIQHRETDMHKQHLIAIAFVLAAVVLSGVAGVLSAPIATAAYFSIVALSATLLVLTSRPATQQACARVLAGASQGVLVGAAA
jgi:hypothetical protein